jgi:Secretion system C-terminal sorting domain
MKIKSLLSFLLAGAMSLSAAHAQSFCLDIGDGVAGPREQGVVKLINSAPDLAFLAIDGVPSEDMKTMVGKVSQDGSLLWSKSFDLIEAAVHGNNENAKDIIETANGHLVIASAGSEMMGITRIQGSSGNFIHAKTYPGFIPAYLRELPNGNIIVIGHRTLGQNLSAVMLDASLNFVDAIDLKLLCKPSKLVKVPAGYYGVGSRYNGNFLNAVTFALDNNLQVLWAREYNTGNFHSTNASLAVLPDGSILTVGRDGNCEPINDGRLFLNRYSSAGVLLKTVKIAEADHCILPSDILVAPSGTTIIAGSYGIPWSQSTIWAFDASGIYLGAMTHSPGSANTLVASPQGRIFFGGSHDLYPNRGEGLVTRLLADGSSCCSQPHLFTIQESSENDLTQTPPAPTHFVLTPTPYVLAQDFGTPTLICGPSTKAGQAHQQTSGGKARQISPNPAHDQLQLDLPGDGPSELQLLDLQGRLLREASLPAGQHSLPVSDLESGVYLLRIQGPGGLSTHKLSVQH